MAILAAVGALVVIELPITPARTQPHRRIDLRADPRAASSADAFGREPSYLPAGASRAEIDNPILEADNWRAKIWRLPGRANENTIPPEGITAANAKLVHPATVLRLEIARGIDLNPHFGPNWITRAVDVSGRPGRLVTFATGYGNQSVIWSDGEYTYKVSCPRYHTADGPSGISLDELLRVANSMYLR